MRCLLTPAHTPPLTVSSPFVPGRFESWAPTIGSVLDKEKETVCLCHHGVRSMQMAQWLVSAASGRTSLSWAVQLAAGLSACCEPPHLCMQCLTSRGLLSLAQCPLTPPLPALSPASTRRSARASRV